MKKITLLLYSSLFLAVQLFPQNSRLIVLGDLHYDLIQNHDMDWLKTKPDDLRQVIEEYTVYTRENWEDFMNILRNKAFSFDPPVIAVVQLGDLSEGLAGTEVKAMQMAADVMEAIDLVQMPVPWIIAKGNHDITGPGAERAFREYYVPEFRKQTNNPAINNASYSYSHGNVMITCIDPWDRETDMVAFLDIELSGSDAKYKFVALHEPVIPVTERCWYVLRRDLERREKLLEVVTSHKAIVLCAHLHRYSVVRRETKYGPVVQVMINSVVKDRNIQVPAKVITDYDPSLAENITGWQPETLPQRKEMLAEEAKWVTWYKQADLPGYAIISIDENKGQILMEYYAAFGEKPYDIIDLTNLLKP